MKRISRKKISALMKMLSLAFGVFILLLIELGVRAIVPETHLDQITDILERDPALIWRNRANMKTVFAGVNVATDANGFRILEENAPQGNRGSAYRVICLGASPTFGWGVKSEESYPHRLQELLRKEKGINADVINGGMIGFSSHQGLIFLKSEVLSMKPDMITVSYVINDIDKYRFFRSDGRPDRELEPESNALTAMRTALEKSRFFRLFEKTFNYVLGRRTTFDGKPVAVYRPRSVRVPLNDYRMNMAGIVDFAKDNDIDVVLVKMPVNLPVGEMPPASDEKEASELLRKAIALVEADDCNGATPMLDESLGLNPICGEAHYFRGVCFLRAGNRKAADESFRQAFRSEAFRCGRAGIVYNEALEEIGREKNVPVVDIVAAFENRDRRHLFLSSKNDPIHPSAEGHGIIGRLIFEAIFPLINQHSNSGKHIAL